MAIESKFAPFILVISILIACTSGRAEAPPLDLATASITLERSACFGDCPAYNVTIYGDGRVLFKTGTGDLNRDETDPLQVSRWGGVPLPGTHEDQVAPAVVAELVRRFQAAGFWRLRDRYAALTTHGATATLTIVEGEHRKTVVDYAGGGAEMPRVVGDLEIGVDRVAGTDRWVVGSPALIPWLERAGFDFQSRLATELVVAGEDRSAPEATVDSLIDRGAPLDQSVAVNLNIPPEIAGISLIEAAMRRGHATLFKRLVAEGWLDRFGKKEAAELFARYGAGCSPMIVDIVADAGVDIDRATTINFASGASELRCRTALALLSGACAQNRTGYLLVPTAKRLLARGANPNHHDDFGHTPLFGIKNPTLLSLLLAHGADPVTESAGSQCSSH